MFIIEMVVQTAFYIVLVSLVARFLAQMARADFYNPMAQTVIKITDPFLKPMRRIIPSVAGLDIASIVTIFLGQLLVSLLLILLAGYNPMGAMAQILVWSIIATFSLILTVLQWSMIIVAIASFILMGQHNPFVSFIAQMIEPFVGPFRKLNLQIGMLDLSFMLAFFVIIILKDYILVQTVGGFIGYNARYFIG